MAIDLQEEQFSNLPNLDKLSILKQTIPEIFDLLKVQEGSLNDRQIETLRQIAEVEVQSKSLVARLGGELLSFGGEFAKNVEQSLTASDLDDKDKKSISQIFQQTVIQSAENAGKDLLESTKKGKGVLASVLVNNATLKVMEGVLSFKKKLDEFLSPEVADAVLKILSNCITALVAVISPPAAVALKASGILDKAVDFLKTESLQNSVDTMRDALGAVQKDKKLAAWAKIGEKVAEVSEASGINAKSIANLCLSSDKLDKLKDKLNVRGAKELLENVANYAKEVFPMHQGAVEERVSAVKQELLKSLQENGVVISEKLSKEIEVKFTEATKVLQQNYASGRDFFDKAADQLKGAEIMMGVVRDIRKECGAEMSEKIGVKLEQAVGKKIKGSIGKVVQCASEAPSVAKEALGMQNSHKVLLERGAQSVVKNLSR